MNFKTEDILPLGEAEPDESGRTTSPKGGTTNFTNYSMPLISPNILGNKYIATMIV